MNGSCESMLTHSQRPFNPFFVLSLLMTSGKISSPPQSQKANNSGNISLAPSLRMAHRPGLRKAPKLWTVWSSKYELCVQSPHQAALAGYKGRVLAPKLHNTWIWADTGWGLCNRGKARGGAMWTSEIVLSLKKDFQCLSYNFESTQLKITFNKASLARILRPLLPTLVLFNVTSLQQKNPGGWWTPEDSNVVILS